MNLQECLSPTQYELILNYDQHTPPSPMYLTLIAWQLGLISVGEVIVILDTQLAAVG